MNKQTLKFNLPEGWRVDFHMEEVEDEEMGISMFEEYEILPENDKLFSRIYVSKTTDGDPVGPEELLTYEAEEYLENLNVSESVRPSLEEFIKRCQIGDREAYYCVYQETGEASAIIRVVFDDMYEAVFVNAEIKDWEEGAGEAQAIDFLSGFFAF